MTDEDTESSREDANSSREWQTHMCLCERESYGDAGRRDIDADWSRQDADSLRELHTHMYLCERERDMCVHVSSAACSASYLRCLYISRDAETEISRDVELGCGDQEIVSSGIQSLSSLRL